MSYHPIAIFKPENPDNSLEPLIVSQSGYTIIWILNHISQEVWRPQLIYRNVEISNHLHQSGNSSYLLVITTYGCVHNHQVANKQK